MHHRTSLIAVVLGLFLSSCPVRGADAPRVEGKDTFWVIPHTHWEGAVFKTREEYLEMGLPNILKAMRLLREQPDFRFVLDQVAYVKPFLERYPELEADFRKFLAEGRLQLAGALDVMPDVNMPGGETFIRQMQYGKGYYRDELGVEVTTGWQLDTFGHHAQMPQLLALAGYKSFWIQRGVNRLGSSLGVPLGRNRRNEDPHLLATQQLRLALRLTARPAWVFGLRQAAIRAARRPTLTGSTGWVLRGGCLRAGRAPRSDDRGLQQERRRPIPAADGSAVRVRGDRGKAERPARVPW